MVSSCNQSKEPSAIYDYEDILTARQERKLNGIIHEYQRNTENKIFMLTSKDIGECQTALDFASIFGMEHGLFSVGKTNGVVIFVSKNMKVTSLATGSGSDKSLKDDITKQIIDSCMIPLFKEEQWFDGIKVAVEESIKNWN